MPIVSVNPFRTSLSGAPIILIDDDGTTIIDDSGNALVDDGADYNEILYATDDDGTALVDDDGTQITDDPPYIMPPVTQWLQAVGANLTLQDGTDFRLRGVNWSGFESRMFPGLLSVRAYKSITINGVVQQGILDQIAAVGFNAVRFPICEDMTWDRAICQSFDGVSVALNPDLINYNFLPAGADTANGYALISPLEILDKMVAYAKSIGLRVVLDMHCSAPNTDNSIGFNGRWYTSTGPQGPAGTTLGLAKDPRNEQSLIDAWVVLANRYKDEPAVCGFDLINEPWDTTWDDDPMTGLPAAYERIGNAIQAVNPDVLIICEGNLITEDQLPAYPSKYGTWPAWGQNLWGVHFRKVKLAVRQDKLCYAPHEYYGPEYNWTQDYSFPQTMIEVWDTLWGWIVNMDIAPIIITEWGGNFSGAIPDNVKWADALMNYMYTNMGGKVNWFHWAMVPGNSSTGPDQTVVGLIKQMDGAGGSNTLWPMQEDMVRRFIAGSQNA
ncbi:glycoside hydrolase family 5 protein [Paraburkholderia sp. BR10882]|uniref:glycoside hydrolase family 5 protein n=1 Tax=unclassified Paraburkholderia TaxID=2615204 RepID=UPI0034CFB116